MEAMVAASGVAEPDRRRLAAVKLAVLFYPYAGPLARTAAQGWGDLRPAVFACLAGRDAVVGRRAPRRALDRLRVDGLAIEVLDLPDATHSFDDDAYSDPRTRYREDLARKAESAYSDVLRRALIETAPA
jgi:dienelactone hydrolase